MRNNCVFAEPLSDADEPLRLPDIHLEFGLQPIAEPTVAEPFVHCNQIASDLDDVFGSATNPRTDPLFRCCAFQRRRVQVNLQGPLGGFLPAKIAADFRCRSKTSPPARS